jgi:CHAT domain-containing protein/tetratricopeptide (TPR) repeat protein
MCMHATRVLFIACLVTLLLVTGSAAPCRAGETAAELRAAARELERQGKFVEAAGMHEQAAAEGRRQSGTSRSVSGIRTAAVDHQAIATDLSFAGLNYLNAGEFVRAVDAYQRTLAVLREGRIEMDIPLCLNSIAWPLFRLGRNEEGLKYLADAIEAAKNAGMDREAADFLNGRGRQLTSFGRYAEAVPAHQEAQRLYRKLGDENAVANMYNNIGQAYQGRGEYDKAVDVYQQSYGLHRSIGKEAEAAVNMNNIGLVHELRGQYDKALQAYEKALAVYRDYKLESEIPTTLNNIGNIYFAWARFDKALAYYEEALALSRKQGNAAGTATRLGSICNLYLETGRYGDALKHCEEALSLVRAAGRNDDAADALNRIGLIHIKQGDQNKALTRFDEALAITKTTGNLQIRSASLSNRGQIHFFRKEYDRAQARFEEALAISRKLRNDEGAANMLYNIGRVQYENGDYAGADRSFQEAVQLKEQQRRTAPGALRRDYTARQIATYQYLASADIRQQQYSDAVKSIEHGRAKYLAEQIAGGEDGVVVRDGDAVRRELPEDAAVILYANTNQRHKVIMAITRGGLLGREVANLDLYDAKWSRFSDEASAGLSGARGVRLVEREQKAGPVVDLKPSCSCDAVINYYRTLLIASGQAARGAAIRPRREQADDEIRTLARLLYRIFVKPVEGAIAGKKKLMIVTDGALGFLPFETLIDDSGKFLIETHEITYIQSLAVLDLLRTRVYEEKRKPLIAFGGALYDAREPKTAKGAGSGAPPPADGSVRGRYAEIGLGAWADLPYTLTEVQSLAAIVPGSDVYRGEQVSESTVKDLNRRGDLARYKVIHFATHGMVVPAYPELSALVLSQRPTQGEDGYLRMEEIAKLRLRADFVNLSACDTGLGRLYEGEGVVSLAHAFLIAGANGLSVSLWQVADESTAKFMAGVYELAFTRGWSYARAMAEMKRRFIHGEHGAAYGAPFYWAPFVYYGR